MIYADDTLARQVASVTEENRVAGVCTMCAIKCTHMLLSDPTVFFSRRFILNLWVIDQWTIYGTQLAMS